MATMFPEGEFQGPSPVSFSVYDEGTWVASKYFGIPESLFCSLENPVL